MSVKCLVLVSKETSESGSLPTLINETQTALLSAFGVEIALTDSSTWWSESFPRCGDYESWAWETVHGKEYGTRKPHFDGFVVSSETLGRANAQIANLALRNKRTVLYVVDGAVRSVTEIVVNDGNNWKTGWATRSEALV